MKVYWRRWSVPGDHRVWHTQTTFHAYHRLYRQPSPRLTVSTRMADDDFSLSVSTFKYLFLNAHNLALWAPAFCLAVLLRIITHRYEHQLIFPLCQFVSYLCNVPHVNDTSTIQTSYLLLLYSMLSLRRHISTLVSFGGTDGYST